MAEKKRYTALDIEKYHRGELSRAEMHAMEKAALDDPFLAEAMEGYGLVSGDHGSAVGALRKQLDRRTRKSFAMPLMRVAAVLLLLLGAGLLLRELTDQKKSGIAKLSPPKTETTQPTTDTVTGPATETPVNNSTTSSGRSGTTSVNSGKTARESFDTLVSSIAAEPPVANVETTTVPEIKDVVVHQPAKKAEPITKETMAGKTEPRNETVNLSKRAGPYPRANNYFRGRVTDPKNNPVPFANILNTSDSTATYADADGNFTVASDDTSVEVRVRSIGYEIFQARLSEAASNQITLRDMPRSGSEVVVNATGERSQRKSAFDKRSQQAPEPEDGWENYGVYLANNLQLPGEFRDRSGTVELSFQVDNFGRPYNIRVEKSLCPPCDAEAIRLIREGPRWESRSRRGRAVLSIPFTSYQR